MRKHWDRWGWTIAVGIIATIFLRVVFGREPFCGPESEHCLREWLSAVGGWAAVGAAVPSILYLARQVMDADTQYKISKALEVRRLRALAHHIIKHSEEVERVSREYIVKFEKLKTGKGVYKYTTAVMEIGVIHKFIQSSHFITFENEIFVPGRSVTFIKAQFDFVTDLFGGMTPDNNLEEKALGIAITVTRVALDYAVSIKQQAKIYLDDTARFDMSALSKGDGKPSHD
ncbi:MULTISPECIES: hypothetical protein [Rhizobium]|uniref:hypothetical protein n=1 Tax=Rhizobium TaxID=379 RepID=UPI0028AE1D10